MFAGPEQAPAQRGVRLGGLQDKGRRGRREHEAHETYQQRFGQGVRQEGARPRHAHAVGERREPQRVGHQDHRRGEEKDDDELDQADREQQEQIKQAPPERGVRRPGSHPGEDRPAGQGAVGGGQAGA